MEHVAQKHGCFFFGKPFVDRLGSCGRPLAKVHEQQFFPRPGCLQMRDEFLVDANGWIHRIRKGLQEESS